MHSRKSGGACGLAKHRITTHTHIRIKLLIHSAVVMCVDVVRAHSGILSHVPQSSSSQLFLSSDGITSANQAIVGKIADWAS